MIIKKLTYNTCGECSQPTNRVPTVYGCDRCGRTLEENSKLELILFSGIDGSDIDMHYCNWYCLMADLPSRDGYEFITFPALYPAAVEEFLDACKFKGSRSI